MDKKKPKKPGCAYCGCTWHELIWFQDAQWCRCCLNKAREYGLISKEDAEKLGLE